MASEITVAASITVRNGNMIESIAPGQKLIDQAAVGGPSPGYVTIATTEENVTFPEISSLGWLFLQNLDATNYIEWGFSATVYGGQLLPGEYGLFRLKPGVSLFMKANVAACKAIVKAFEA